MSAKIENALDDFYNDENQINDPNKYNVIDNKKLVINERDGLLEKLNVTYVDQFGRQLLREIY